MLSSLSFPFLFMTYPSTCTRVSGAGLASEPIENHHWSRDTLCRRHWRAETCRSERARARRVERWRLGRRARYTRTLMTISSFWTFTGVESRDIPHLAWLDLRQHCISLRCPYPLHGIEYGHMYVMLSFLFVCLFFSLFFSAVSCIVPQPIPSHLRCLICVILAISWLACCSRGVILHDFCVWASIL